MADVSPKEEFFPIIKEALMPIWRIMSLNQNLVSSTTNDDTKDQTDQTA
jgi:hypothetical protein